MMLKKYSSLLIFLTAPLFSVFADNAIIHFAEPLAINISGKYAIVGFSQEQSAQYTTDRPWSLGLGIRYKNYSASVFFPSFYAFDDNPFESFDIQLASYYDFIYYEAFCKRYQGFTDGETEDKNIDLNLFSSGVSAGWLQNSKNHSLSAVYDLDGKQASSSGSAILGFGVYYTSMLSDDKNIKRYSIRQDFIYFGPNIGYSYTFIFSKDIFVNLNLVIGLDAGVNSNTNKWLFIPILMPKMSFGHHHSTWSINVTAGCNYTAVIWDINTIDNLIPSTMTVTFSKRF